MGEAAARDKHDLGVPTKVHRRDPATLKPLLTDMLAPRFPERQALRVTDVAVPTGAGVNNETVLLDLSWRDDGAERTGGAVLRMESDDSLFPEPPFATHFQLYQLMRRQRRVPVPDVWGLTSEDSALGKAFFFMERIEGRVPSDQPPFHTKGWFFDATAEDRRAMWLDAIDVMARLHATPVDTVDFLHRPALGRSGVEQELGQALGYLDWALDGDRHPILEASARWLRDNLPADAGTALAWGDARPQNLMFRDNKVVAVFDWDMVSLAGPEADFAWWTLMDLSNTVSRGITRLPGWGSPAETMARWEEVTGRTLRNMDWHYVFAAFRGGIIVMRLAKILAAKGLLPPQSADWKDNNIGIQYCASLLGLKPMTADSLPWPGPDA